MQSEIMQKVAVKATSSVQAGVPWPIVLVAYFKLTILNLSALGLYHAGAYHVHEKIQSYLNIIRVGMGALTINMSIIRYNNKIP